MIGRLLQVPVGIDKLASRVDRWFSQPGGVEWFHERSPMAFLLPLPVYLVIVFGPTFLTATPAWRGPLPLLLVAAGVLSQVVYFRFVHKPLRLAWLHFVMVTSLAAVSFFAASPSATQHSPQMYRHVFGWAAALLIGVAIPVSELLRQLPIFRVPPDVVARFGAAIAPGELIKGEPAEKRLTFADLLRAYAVSLTATPIHLLIIPAFVAVLATPDWLYPAVLIALLVSWTFFAIAEYDPERDALVRLVTSAFLSGATLFVSLGVLALGALRLLKISYVTAVLDAAPGKILVSYLVSAYCVLWFYDFWVHQRALDLLEALPFRRSGPAASQYPLRRHGAGRIAVLSDKKERVFTAGELLTAISSSRGRGAPSQTAANRTNQRLLALFATTTLVAIALSVVGIAWLACSTPRPLIETHGAAQFAPVDLRTLLARAPANGPAIVLAGSGGGTRAALWTSAVLHGISRLDKLHDVVLVSGVSGGSAALAYFAEHRPELLASAEAPAWHDMQETLAAPYIGDVLAGAAEWRLVRGTQLGQLLAEGFEREFNRQGGALTRRALGQIADLGLIFNSSICSDSASTTGEGHAGGRLLITNLAAQFSPAPGAPELGWKLDWPLVAVRDPGISLFSAAAASANFPPVFPDALVRIDGGKREVWVTDGGAIENRGVIEPLLALNEALAQWPRTGPPPPQIRIVVAEASALGAESGNDRGVGAALGASTQLANRVVAGLLTSAAALHRELSGSEGGVRLVYLPMPPALRAAGTFGTHWMMPPRVPIGVQNEKHMSFVKLPAEKVRTLIDALLSPRFDKAFLQEQLGEEATADLGDALNAGSWQTLSANLAIHKAETTGQSR